MITIHIPAWLADLIFHEKATWYAMNVTKRAILKKELVEY